MLVVIWLATIVYTFLDARRRIEDPFLVACATVAAFFPFIGTAVYAILRPPELVEDARERDLEIRTAELRLRHLVEQSCPNCNYPIDKNYLRCPECERHLKDPCETCNRPIDPRWSLCPYCETRLPGRHRGAVRQEDAAPPPGHDDVAPARQAAEADQQEAARGRRGQEAQRQGGEAQDERSRSRKSGSGGKQPTEGAGAKGGGGDGRSKSASPSGGGSSDGRQGGRSGSKSSSGKSSSGKSSSGKSSSKRDR